jgi:phosphomannomutase
LIYYLEDGTKICARPSGTEPKIKFYFSVNAILEEANDFEEANRFLDTKIQNIITEMKLN